MSPVDHRGLHQGDTAVVREVGETYKGSGETYKGNSSWNEVKPTKAMAVGELGETYKGNGSWRTR